MVSSLTTLRPLYPREKKHGTHQIGLQGRSGRSGEEKILTPPGQLKDKELGPLVE